jgi:hypothetical protein
MDLKERIKEKGIKQVWIAKKVGMSKSLFHHYLNNYKNMAFPQEVESKIKDLLS